MRVIRLAAETDLAGWRAAARSLRAEGVGPEAVIWTVDAARGGVFGTDPDRAGDDGGFSVPRGFLELADLVVLHRSPERFALLYRLLWRLGEEPGLLRQAADPDVARARAFALAVDRAVHKMKAFVRFRPIAGEAVETFAAWFEPAHRVALRTAPFFQRRFAGRRFSLMTPDVCLHWDGAALRQAPGADPADVPAEAGLEDFWRANCAGMFARAEPSRRDLRAAQRRARDGPFEPL